jgi:hypothetical protein
MLKERIDEKLGGWEAVKQSLIDCLEVEEMDVEREVKGMGVQK